MRFLLPVILLLGHLVQAQKEFDYPPAPRDTTTDKYFDEIIEDSYQWMENPNDPRLARWLKTQSSLTKKISNQQTRIWELRAQVASMYSDTRRKDTEDYMEREDELTSKYLFKYNWINYGKSPDLLYKLNGTTNYRKLYKANDFKKNKDDHVMVGSRSINEKEDFAVITLSINGSDWETGYVFDLKTGEQLFDTLKYIRSGSDIRWYGKDLYYDAYEKPATGRELLDKARGQKLYRITIGSGESPEILYRNPDISGTNSFDFFIYDKKLILYHFIKSRGNYYKAISIADMKAPTFFPKNFMIYPNTDSISLDVEHISGDSIFIQTNWNAPNGKVLLANLNQPNQLSEFVPELDIPLRSVNKLGRNKLALVYLNNDQNIALIYDFQGKLLNKIEFPKGKKLNYFYEYEDEANYVDFSISSFFHPPLWYQISLDDLSFRPKESLSVPYDPDKLETRYITYTSGDGTKIPMYITCRKDIELDGTNPVLLYGYGGYGITVQPYFNSFNTLFLLYNGIVAVPNIRGGGAKGSHWAKEGRRLNKQNAIDDFISAAEYLINEGYTSTDKMAASGASHGGLLVGAAITQRPDLFKMAIAEAGVYDMLRFHKYTAGAVNTNLNEFGAPNNYEDYLNLKSYSPLHRVKKGVKYPNLLLITGDTDDRVPPHNSYKFLAQMQEYGDPTGLYMMYITPGSGHGGALTGEDWVDYILFKYYFLFDQMGIDFF